MMLELSSEELYEVLNLVRVRYGYDFTGYAQSSLKRRVVRFLQMENVSVFDLKYNMTNDPEFFLRFKRSLTVNVTEMFRDPHFYKKLREVVLPVLATYPVIKIWHAGCSTGEEPFSMAILLHEAGLLDRTRIYATDLNSANLERAASGIIPLAHMKNYIANYQLSGGVAEFADYYTARYDHAIIHSELRRNIVFSQHNLVTDYAFNEFQLICCRNVLIYFNKELQSRVIDLFCQSLSPLGFLALGTKESLLFSSRRSNFDVVSLKDKIFRVKNERNNC